MECVAIGAAIQGAVLTGDIKDIVLLDVTPLTLGIETLGGVSTSIIPANTTIPTQKSQIFSTAADGQTVVTIHVVQGDRAMAKDNVSLGMFNLEGIPSAPRGIPQIEVAFDIDANGILTVTAKDKATNKQQRISIEAKNKLSKEEIEKMKKEAEQFAEDDKKRKDEIEKVNLAETLAYTTEKTISENKDKIDQKDQDEATELIKNLREALKDNDMEKVDSLSDELSKKAQAIGMAMYTKAQESQSAQENQSQETAEPPNEPNEEEKGDADSKEENQ